MVPPDAPKATYGESVAEQDEDLVSCPLEEGNG